MLAQPGDLVLAKNQNSGSENGVYLVASGSWTKIGQPEQVNVREGTANGRCIFILSGSNVYSGVNAIPA